MSLCLPIELAEPFVLLDDARAQGVTFLYRRPSAIIIAEQLEEVVPALDRLRQAKKAGFHAAGFLSYAARSIFEPRLGRDVRRKDGLPLLWFGLFSEREMVDRTALLETLDAAGPARIADFRPAIDFAAYVRAFEKVKALIQAGDIYQANLTFGSTLSFHGSRLGLYRQIRQRGAAPWGAIVHTGSRWILSASPELFFRLDGDYLTTKPMKGTAPAGADPDLLRHDPKQCAENLMIVDLLRNDMARVAIPGSVRVTRLFEVERYPTVQQMTSTIEARLLPGCDAIDVLHALFPCGSITGAPKIRAVEITNALETGTRGLYTGSIGRFDPNGDAAFNVAIRTLVLDTDGTHGRLGLGSAIVADSEVEAEWAECLAKARFAVPDIQAASFLST